MPQKSATCITMLVFVLVALTTLAGSCSSIFGEASCFEHGGIDSGITNNHGHELRIPAEDFTNPVDGTYSI